MPAAGVVARVVLPPALVVLQELIQFGCKFLALFLAEWALALAHFLDLLQVRFTAADPLIEVRLVGELEDVQQGGEQEEAGEGGEQGLARAGVGIGEALLLGQHADADDKEGGKHESKDARADAEQHRQATRPRQEGVDCYQSQGTDQGDPPVRHQHEHQDVVEEAQHLHGRPRGSWGRLNPGPTSRCQLCAVEEVVTSPSGGSSEATLSRPVCVRTGSVPALTVWSKTLSSFSLSNIISSRLKPVRSNSVVSSMASTGQACSHMPQ